MTPAVNDKIPVTVQKVEPYRGPQRPQGDDLPRDFEGLRISQPNVERAECAIRGAIAYEAQRWRMLHFAVCEIPDANLREFMGRIFDQYNEITNQHVQSCTGDIKYMYMREPLLYNYHDRKLDLCLLSINHIVFGISGLTSLFNEIIKKTKCNEFFKNCSTEDTKTQSRSSITKLESTCHQWIENARNCMQAWRSAYRDHCQILNNPSSAENSPLPTDAQALLQVERSAGNMPEMLRAWFCGDIEHNHGLAGSEDHVSIEDGEGSIRFCASTV